jgi:ribosome-binding factor A
MILRTKRVNKLIREGISELLQRQVKDPRLGNFVTVTGVSTSPDLRRAKIFVSVMGSEEAKGKTLQGLASASGFFRWELAGRLRMRRTPELSFCLDDSIEHGDHLLQLMEQLNTESADLDEQSRS